MAFFQGNKILAPAGPRRIINSMTMIRTFIAAETAPEIRRELYRAQGRLKTEISGRISWVQEKNIHLTLKFLGEINPGRLEPIREKLKEIAAGSCKFSLTLDGLGSFPNNKNPRIIWAGLKAAADCPLFAIAARIEQELAGLGLKKEQNPFHPHLTLGRVKQLKKKIDLSTLYPRITLPKISFEVENITLFQSTLTSTGPIYSPLAVFPLKKD